MTRPPTPSEAATSYACPVRGCTGKMHPKKTLIQHHTAALSFIVVCNARPDIHRGWIVETVGTVNRASRGRWGWSGNFDV
jgi:hypothetical protein